MVATLEENKRGQMAGAPYERETFQQAAETAGEQRPSPETGLPAGREHLLPLSLVVSGATVATIGGIATLILTIIGLSGVAGAFLSGVSSIIVGGTFLMLATIIGVWALMFRFAERRHGLERTFVRTSVLLLVLGGAAGITLGILSLISPAVISLTAAAVVAMGGTLMWNASAMWVVSRFTLENAVSHRRGGFLDAVTFSLSPARNFLVGAGAAALGILSLCSVLPATLTLVGLLTLGAGLLIIPSTLCAATVTTLGGMR